MAHDVQARHPRAERRQERRGHQGGQGHGVEAVPVPVGPRGLRAEELIYVDLLLADDVVVRDHDAKHRPQERGECVQLLVHAIAVAVEVPRRQEDGADGHHHATDAHADVLRGQVREVEGRRHEVRHEVDADGGQGEGQRAQERHHHAVELAHQLDRVVNQPAETQLRRGHNDGCEQREAQKVDGQAHEIAHLDRLHAPAVAREVAEAQHHRREVGDHRMHDRQHNLHRRPTFFGLPGQLEVYVTTDHGPDALADGERDHEDVHDWASPIQEATDGPHALPEQGCLNQPEEQEGGPTQTRESQEAADFHTRVGSPRGEDLQHQHQEGARGQVCLDAVPHHGSEPPGQRRHVGAADAEGHAADDGERRACGLAGPSCEVAEPLHERDAYQHGH
mmetsp:Transcript_67102/g.216430  ORF Transcript_67102/g.216430 Transcript_67102/m.216430 type:complete len:392 (+) Transcript_67102:360-1535(+)